MGERLAMTKELVFNQKYTCAISSKSTFVVNVVVAYVAITVKSDSDTWFHK